MNAPARAGTVVLAPATEAVWVVDGVGDAPSAGEMLCLVAPLPVHRRFAALAGAGPRRSRREVVEVALPGIGARYLSGVARVAAALGWNLPELAALVVELESRCSYWLAAASLEAITGERVSFGLGRGRALHWSHRGWSPAEPGGEQLVLTAHAAAARGAICVGARSGGRVPRRLHRRIDELRCSGVTIGEMGRGVAAALGTGWAVEALTAPRLSAAQLGGLREQLSAAPRCGWCGIPVAGPRCRRCAPGTWS